MRAVTEIMHRSAAEAAEKLTRREVSSRELTEMLLARIDALDPALEGARRAAG
jgi:Asp-tRNA(Asn)/Glu-tRNA(Gln) amidotransferase A subunit family amidase